MQNETPKLWDHQKDAVDKAGDYFALFFEAGTGKTATAINILRKVYSKNGKILPTLILCPPVVINNWKNEILKYSKIKDSNVYCLTKSAKDRVNILKVLGSDSIVITNYEALNMPEVFMLLKKFIIFGCLILDESHRIKDISALRTKRAIELSDICKYKYILSGTPILNNLMDVFSQFRVLDGGERFGKNYFSFRSKFFEDKNKHMPRNRHFPNWQLIRGSEKVIKDIMSPVSMFVEKNKCLSLPPFVRKTIEVELGTEQKRLYEAMKRDLVATIKTESGKDKHSIAELAITKALRLQQIVSGHIKVEGENGEDGITIQIKDNPRKEALKQLLEDLAPYHKILVWAVFKANYDDIRSVCQSLNCEYAELHGEVKNRNEQIDNFNNNPKYRVLIGHPGSGGIGVNLIAASYSIFYSRSFSLEFDIQAEARNYRGGSEIHEKITRIDIVTKNTIDELVLKSLASKQALSESVLKNHLNEI